VSASLAAKTDQVRDLVAPVLDRVRQVADWRNEIVHSLFPDPTMERAIGHRPVVERLRPPGSSEWSIWVETSERDLTALIREQVDAMDALARVRAQLQRFYQSNEGTRKDGQS
jgi:hypothetical protein